MSPHSFARPAGRPSPDQPGSKEVQDAGKDEATGSGSASPQEAGRAVPPAQDGALPHRAIPGVDEELGYGGLRGFFFV